MNKSLDIPLNAEVLCEDGKCGRSKEMIIDPQSKELTHLVVETNDLPFDERLVPIRYIIATTSNMVQLNCTKNQFRKFEIYCETEMLPDPHIDPVYDMMGNYYVFPLNRQIVIEHKSIPKGEMPLVRYTRIDASDGHIGRLDELLVDAETDRITHLVMREGHLFGEKDVTIPITEIEQFGEKHIKLKLTKEQVKKLPEIPIRR